MAKLFTTQDLITTHKQLRSIVSLISKEATSVRKNAKAVRAEAEKIYADAKIGKAKKNELIKQHVKAAIDTTAKPVREKIAPMLRQMEGIRLQIEEGRDNMTNPIRRLNAVTLMDPKYSANRNAAMVMFAGMSAPELEVAAEAAKSANDLGMLAAIVSKNNQLKPSDRIFTNAELLKDVKLPGQQDIDAVYQEVVTLPAYAMACDRAFDKLGDLSPTDRLELGLADRQVNINEDGTLAEFQTSEAPRYKLDGTELFQPDKPKPNDGEPINAADFKTFDEYMDAGGKMSDFSDEDAKRWWPMDGSEEFA